MITINGTLGTGLYWRGGQILELGGPLAVLLSFLLVGLLSVAVMQCITEMLCIWPIPGALSVYVSEFVDVELGIAVGIAYWYVDRRNATESCLLPETVGKGSVGDIMLTAASGLHIRSLSQPLSRPRLQSLVSGPGSTGIRASTEALFIYASRCV